MQHATINAVAVVGTVAFSVFPVRSMDACSEVRRPSSPIRGRRCGHCRQLMPDFERAAVTLKSGTPVVQLAQVDATAETDLAEQSRWGCDKACERIYRACAHPIPWGSMQRFWRSARMERWP